ncbi:glycine/D-amino acid oxidase-like deaminating enzyme [Rhodobacter sp. JA431]|uniref:NAD(P)/FAD-dependent oxidoreductase n=1 Tax=Rhodobacter sp. JA431 TaxID=570013 RepID=UPI000BCBDD5C|nr:FAD-binding oxidoreductase [Rhodobacter sp. JA431]SOB92361.1 glycine/D-amino acid oxidase-like deaminating enzyme [Rhodobacter sp. JA431]
MQNDFLILGGGIAGLSAAARLAPLGSLTLLETEDHLAHHASSRSAALYEPRYGNPAVVALSLASGDFYHGSGLLSDRGFMIVDGLEHEARFNKQAAAFEVAKLSFTEAQALFPILNPKTVTFAGYAEHAWDIDTDALVQAYAREARAAGASIRTKAKATRITRLEGGWEVEAGGETFTAKLLINAAGAWVDEVAQMAGVTPLGFKALRRSMARIPAPGGHDVSRWPMVIGGAEDWYCKPDAGALIVSPAEEDPVEPHDAWADDMVLAEGLARYEEAVTEPVTRLLANWAGLRTFAPDRAPVIGFDAKDPSFFWLAGQGGYGFQSAPAAAELVTDLIGGRVPSVEAAILSALDPKRFG